MQMYTADIPLHHQTGKQLKPTKMKKFQTIAILTVLMLICAPIVSMAAGPGFSGNVADGGACAPLDEGTCTLLAAGAGYVAKLLMPKRKKVAATTEK